MRRRNADGVPYFSLAAWDASSVIAHGFFTRIGGVSPPPFASLNGGRRGGDSPDHVRENRKRAASALSISAEQIIWPSQVHGDRLWLVSEYRPRVFGSEDPPEADGLFTQDRGVFLGILTADCVPIFLYDPRRPAVGIVHAGWRGTEKGIAGKAVRKMREAFGSRPPELLAALGPAVGPCCYVVGEEVARAFVERDPQTGPFLHPQGPRQWKLNLAGINRHQLVSEGVAHRNITVLSLCTCCRTDLFFSVRAEGEPTGRQMAVVGLR
jgi:hypothetical protein